MFQKSLSSPNGFQLYLKKNTFPKLKNSRKIFSTNGQCIMYDIFEIKGSNEIGMDPSNYRPTSLLPLISKTFETLHKYHIVILYHIVTISHFDNMTFYTNVNLPLEQNI